MEFNDLEKLYKDKLQDLEIHPDAAVWDKIEMSLNSEKKSKKRILFWVASVVGIAALFVVGFFSFYENTKLPLTKKLMVQIVVEKDTLIAIDSKKKIAQKTTPLITKQSFFKEQVDKKKKKVSESKHVEKDKLMAFTSPKIVSKKVEKTSNFSSEMIRRKTIAVLFLMV